MADLYSERQWGKMTTWCMGLVDQCQIGVLEEKLGRRQENSRARYREGKQGHLVTGLGNQQRANSRARTESWQKEIEMRFLNHFSIQVIQWYLSVQPIAVSISTCLPYLIWIFVSWTEGRQYSKNFSKKLSLKGILKTSFLVEILSLHTEFRVDCTMCIKISADGGLLVCVSTAGWKYPFPFCRT